jgi:hypothetical protein
MNLPGQNCNFAASPATDEDFQALKAAMCYSLSGPTAAILAITQAF